MDKPLDLAGVTIITGYAARLYFHDVQKQGQRLLAQFDSVLVDFDSMAHPRLFYKLINGQLDMELFTDLMRRYSLDDSNYQLEVRFSLEAIKPIPIGEFPEESVITRHKLKLNNCLVAPLGFDLDANLGTVSIQTWRGTAKDIVEVG